MKVKLENLIQDVINEDELVDVRGGLMSPPKYGCQTGVCINDIGWANSCTSAVCQTGA